MWQQPPCPRLSKSTAFLGRTADVQHVLELRNACANLYIPITNDVSRLAVSDAKHQLVTDSLISTSWVIRVPCLLQRIQRWCKGLQRSQYCGPRILEQYLGGSLAWITCPWWSKGLIFRDADEHERSRIYSSSLGKSLTTRGFIWTLVSELK